ncbi:hypothetical protein QYE76_022398 [Lolium multiflorum]|uniref:Uncharacterized protein n=1 Tax=Lolium multiflorum TaxID=4521 RepID=A0AAD8VT55_LOLMU|nr:hypothetical protein QYE76_022398 [Lolium multiflorum]
MAAADLGAAEWERSKITNQDLNLLKKVGLAKPKAVAFPVKSYPTSNGVSGSDEKEDASEATASAQSPPPAVSPKNKRKRNDAEDSGTSNPKEAVPSRQKAAYDPYLETLISSKDLTEELKELRGQLQSVKKQSLMLMEQSRESSEKEKIALQQAQAAIAEKDSAVAEAAAATSRENSMLQLLIDASLDMAGAFLDAATEDERVEARSSVLLRLAREHGSTFWGTPERTRQIVDFKIALQVREYLDFYVGQIVPKCLEKMSKRKRNFGKYDDIVTPVAEDMMDELLRMDAEFFVKGSYAEHSTRAVNNERLTIDNILGNP